MPELPEVETLKRELHRALVGKIFQDTKKKILGIDRRAKILIFHLSGGQAMLVHLKMTGQLVYKNVVGGHPAPPDKYTRKVFPFTDGSKLLFNDLRKFGWIKMVRESDLPKIFSKTGVEPLGKEFTFTTFKNLLARYPKRKLKAFLLDQTLIAGLGNIYVDESCFLAGILPTRTVGSLTANEIKKLHEAIIKILKLSISKKGTSARNYVRSNGERGGFVPHLNVYGRGKEACKICRTAISKIKLNGRGTHFCAQCQK